MLSPDQLNILACPACKGALSVNEAAGNLHCRECGINFPIREGIPILLIDEATADNRD